MLYKSRIAPFLVWTLLIFSLTPALANDIIKSSYDSRAYEQFELPNRLKVLLVSDPEAEKAAASMDVLVGSNANPIDRPGLAHFLEHMLFLGTATYPEADSYQAFISSNGGSHNAFTAYENTNYFFDINPNALPEALDRFSRFFIDPLFSPEYVDRERHAVESEFQSRRRDDRRREHEVTKQIMNPEHAWSRFAVGDLHSLSDREGSNIQDELVDFYNQYYSANLMSLVVIGPQSIPELKELVTERFTDIRDFDASAYIDTAPLFVENSLPKKLEIQTLRQMRQLSLSFPVPSLRDHWRDKPLYYIASLLGYEGEGSLLSYLKSENLATELGAFTAIDLDNEGLFQVSIALTEDGMNDYSRVVTHFFEFVNAIAEKGIDESLYAEERNMAELQFLFADRRQPIHDVMIMAQMQQRYPTEEILRANFLLETFDENTLKDFLSFLNPDNMLLTLMAQELKTDQSERRYNAPFKVSDVLDSNLDSWRSATTNDSLFVRSLNPFVPENLSLVDREDSSEIPMQLLSSPGISLWHQQDQTFERPRADFFVALMTHQAMASANNAVMIDLYTRMVNDQLNEVLYDASLAGLSLSVYPHMRGLSLQLSGYNDKQMALLAKVLPLLRHPEMDSRRFMQVKRQLQERLINLQQETPYQLSLQHLFTSLMSRWSTDDKLEALERLSLEELEHFISELYTELDVRMLAHGNLTTETSIAMADLVKEALLTETRAIPAIQVPVVKLPASEDLRTTLKLNHHDAVLTQFLQGKDNSSHSRAAVALLNEIISTPFYSEMRTEKQFGYIVFSNYTPMGDVPGLALIVQSSVADPITLESHFSDFLDRMQEEISTMEVVDIQRYQTSLVSRLLQPDTSMSARSQRYWRELDRDGSFSSHQQVAESVQKIQKEDLEQTLSELRQRQFFLRSFGKFETDPEALASDNADSNIQSLREQRAFFQLD